MRVLLIHESVLFLNAVIDHTGNPPFCLNKCILSSLLIYFNISACVTYKPIPYVCFCLIGLHLSFCVPAAAAKGISEVDSTLISQQNGGIPASKKLVTTLPELEYREKGKDKDKEAKKQNLGINNNILQSVDSKVQEIEYMENHINNKRLNNDLVGSTENLLKEELCMASSKNYKNASGTGNSSPRSHSASNGSIPSSSSNKNEKKQKITSKSPSTHKDLMENCIPNNQLSKPDTLVRYVSFFFIYLFILSLTPHPL